MTMNAPNRNTLWATLLVEELARSGLTAASIAPGSRSTPFALAFEAHPDIDVYLHDDERGASFFALGMALASGNPVAIVCTSGTATANFHPAIIEAFYSQVPLIVLTTDRPHEQRESGANQTIDQVKMYGDHVLWSHEVAPPEADPPDRTLRYLRSLANRSMNLADGLRKGPVHLNIPFRKPLEPTEVPSDSVTNTGLGLKGRQDQPLTSFSKGSLILDESQVDAIATKIQRTKRGLIVCGPRSPQGKFAESVTTLSQATGFPILPDALSGVRFGPQTSELVLGHYETFLRKFKPDVELILRFGGMPVSKFLGDYLASATNAEQILISSHGVWEDPTFMVNEFIWTDPTSLCQQLTQKLESASSSTDMAWVDALKEAERICQSSVESELSENFLEASVVLDVIEQLPDSASLFMASSLPVRYLDQFAGPMKKPLRTFANRGASGIDGTIASAIGTAASLDGPMVLITGDLAFYHDMNSLLALKKYDIKLIVVLINNDGGGIFHRLPISKFEPPFNELFITPHGLNFEPVVKMFGLDYACVTQREALQTAFQSALNSENSCVIEVPFDGEQNHQQHKQLMTRILDQLKNT